MKKHQRIQLKEIEATAARFLSGPHVHLGEVEKKTTTITILRTGNFSHPVYGRFTISRELLEGMVKNFNDRTYGQDIFMDVSHAPEKGSAGDIKRLFVEGNRLRASVEWTDYGRDAIQSRGFKYISADFIENWTDNEHEQEHGPVLFGAALVTRPHIKHMEPVQLSESNGDTVVTFVHPETIKHFQSEEIQMKKFIELLKKKFKALNLSEKVAQQLINTFETTAVNFEDNTAALEKFFNEIESAGVQLAEQLNGSDPSSPISIQLGDISVGSSEDLGALVAKKLAEAEAKRLEEEQNKTQALDALRKVFNESIDAAEGLSDETVKILKEAGELITGAMTEDQVKALAAQQITLGNQLESQRKLSSMGYQVPGAAGNVHIQVGDGQATLQLQENINTGLRNSGSAIRLALAEEEKLNPFVRQVLGVFDQQNAAQLQREGKQFANGEVDMASTNLPAGFQRTVIREALSDLRVLELVNTLIDPSATVTTQIPYELRDVSQIVNDGIVYEGQGIPAAGIEQKMDTAYIHAVKIALKITNEVMHFSSASGINWNAYGRNVESNARYVRELIVRRICNELQRASDAYLATDVTNETWDGQMPVSGGGVIKTAQYPIVRPHQVRDLQGSAVGNEENPITVVHNGATLEAYDGTGTQTAGTYYRVTSYNLGYIQLVNEAGTPVASGADTGTNTISYSYATNLVKVDLDVPGGTTLERHLNKLLQAIGGRKAVLADDRFVTPDFSLMSNTMNDTATNAEQFTASGQRNDAGVSASGDLESVKSIGAWATNAPGVDLGDERIIMGQRGTLSYTVSKAFATGTPFEAVNALGQPTGEKVAYGEEYSSIKVPSPIRGRLTSVLAFSFTGR